MSAETTAETGPLKDPVPERARLLVVDDELMNRRLLERIFQREYTVVPASSGHEALEILEDTPIDVVLLDVMMPGLSGLQTLERIRKNPYTANLPVILVTAMVAKEDIVRGLQLGASDYVTKPIEQDVLAARVRTQVTLKRLMDEREAQLEELTRVQEMKDRFLQIASHDLKGPLGNVDMATHLIRRFIADIDNPQAAHLLDLIEVSVETMKTVIADFLDAAALQTGGLQLKLEPISLEPAVLEIVDQYALRAHKKDITLHVAQLPGAIYVDLARFEQVMGNLISNAIKFSPHGATVSIWAETDHERTRIYIADQGPGIPQEERHHLFTQFGKLTPRPTDGESSTGLGLWIVKNLVRLLHGDVGVECPEEGGSVFWIELPAVMQAQSTA